MCGESLHAAAAITTHHPTLPPLPIQPCTTSPTLHIQPSGVQLFKKFPNLCGSTVTTRSSPLVSTIPGHFASTVTLWLVHMVRPEFKSCLFWFSSLFIFGCWTLEVPSNPWFWHPFRGEKRCSELKISRGAKCADGVSIWTFEGGRSSDTLLCFPFPSHYLNEPLIFWITPMEADNSLKLSVVYHIHLLSA